MMPLCTIATRSVAMRMGVALRRLAVGRPARVADADRAGQRLAAEPRLEIDQLALGAAALDVAVDQRGDARRIVAAIFQPLQRLDQQGRDRRLADDSDDAAHGRIVRREGGYFFFLARLAAAARAFSFARSGAARPFFVTWRARPKATAPAGTSSVIDAAGGHVGAPADAHRRHQRAVGADEGVGADHGAVLAVAVVVHRDRAGADVARRRRCRSRRDRRDGWPWRRAPIRVALSSTKLPIWTSSATSEPGRMRANGPMIAPLPMRAPSMSQNALISTFDATRDAGPEAHVGADRDVGAKVSCRPTARPCRDRSCVTPAVERRRAQALLQRLLGRRPARRAS